MDYSKLSDNEIAAKVLIAQGYKLIDDGYGYSIYISDSGRKDIGPKSSRQFVFDPCNNAADAWPIIFKNLIGIEPLYEFDDEDEETSGGIHPDGEWEACHVRNNGIAFRSEHGNPLRAAMIVYLMMQGDE